MTERAARDVAIISTVLAGYFLIAGIAMWKDPPAPADAAVGRGLVLVAVALVFVAVYGCCSWATAWDARARAERRSVADSVQPRLDRYAGESAGPAGPSQPAGPDGA
jgi:hypothetical protein